MRIKSLLLFGLTFVLVPAISVGADDKKDGNGKKKKQQDRGMLEKMDAVPCGAKQKGVTGVGSIWASVGITKMSSDEKLCPRYLLRTDEMEYEIQPTQKKHPAILPVGKEVVFKIKKDHMTVKCADTDDKKTRDYEVVAMKQTDASSDQNAAAAKSDDHNQQ